MATIGTFLLMALALSSAAPLVRGRYILAGREPTSTSSAAAAPSDDDTSIIEDGVTFLNSGKGTAAAKQTARRDVAAAVGRLGSPTSRAQAMMTPSSDDNSIVEHSVTALEGKTGTAAQNAKSAQELTSAAKRIEAAAGVMEARSAAPTAATPTTTFAPSNDDSSTIDNTVTFLNSGKGSPEAKQAARVAFSQAGGRLGSPESMKQATGTPSNDDGSIIDRSVTSLEAHTGTPSQNAMSVQELSGAVNRLSAEAVG